eukprot:TRINITY_DN15719_c0_g1_i1.p1 TRINITY_DN15719_c0_g1~~TRINITY_DN15719_c0_g1_i1.p1  ORF type:complete len:425 (-),score=39.64 TRINITY_DN15719_c0_g1_i1:29-1303(-)
MFDKRTYSGQFIGRCFKVVGPIVLLVIVSFGAGGLLNRIRGGFLSIPEVNTTSTVDAFNVFFHDFNARTVYALPTGILAGVLMREKNDVDPYHLRRYGVGTFVYVSTFLSLNVGWGVYFGLGRNPNGYLSRIGVFDWLIGHDCQGWNETRMFAVEFAGMSLRGLLQTVPSGLLLYSLGYGPDFAIIGILMGTVYEIGWLIPATDPNFGQGIPMSELLWGAFEWFCLSVVILTYRKSPTHSILRLLRKGSKIKKILFWVAIVVIDAILIGSSIAYGFVKQTDMVNQRQTWLGMLSTTVLALLVQIVVFYFAFMTRRRAKQSEGADILNDDDGEYESIPTMATVEHNGQHFTIAYDPTKDTWFARFLNWLIPSAPLPYRYLHPIVRLSGVLGIIGVSGFVIYDIIANRAMRPCPIIWNSTNSTMFY